MKRKFIRITGLALLAGALVFLFAGCGILDFGKTNGKPNPLTIKVEDFSVFLFESSEEIYRANVKSPAMWAGLKEQADRDPAYAPHYKWLYDTYNSWDENRKAQLHEIMLEYHPQPMAEKLIQEGRQGAGLDEIIEFMKDDRAYAKNRSTLVDFYTWYGSNYALPHYAQIVPSLQQKVEVTNGKVESGFDIVGFMEKETGVNLKKKPEALELLLNMRLIGASGFSRDKDSLYGIRWSDQPDKIWAIAFNELSRPFFRTFTGGWSFKLLAGKLKKDDQLMDKFNEDVPYTWEGWIEENLTEGFARYLNVRLGIANDVGEGVFIFDREYAQALVDGFDPQKISLEDFTVQFLEQKYGI
ncbi:hypothetical protein ACOBQJ_15160 [Pelotomaculum propionicicum]|uniref:hypothetical protein n=1 Tax=Pelotomaculum propionicicum TaxID=258475 RepID=UPI003B804ED7